MFIQGGALRKVTLSSCIKNPISVEIHRHQTSAPWNYSLLDQRQREIADQVRMGGAGRLILSELAPTITYGRRTSSQDIFLTPQVLAHEGVELYPVDRGGFGTYHGPGQWVIFPVDHLEALTGDRKGVRKAVQTLLEIACTVGRHYDPHVEIRSGSHLGVWTRRGKFASVGIHIEQGVLLHGLSVNGFKTPQSFCGLRPCGLDTPMDYLLSEPSESAFQSLGERLQKEALLRFWR